MARFDHTYGIEIECYLPDGGSARNAAAAISARGVTCVEEIYNHQTRDHWKIVTDGSLGDMRRGIEVVSPILRGEDDLEAIRRVMGALDDYGCTVSRLCGLHVHVGAGAADTDFFKSLFKTYAYFEPVIDGFMPPSRRQSANMYCRSVTSATLPAIDRAPDLDGLLALLSSRGSEARYHKLNLTAYRRHRTVEFRQHSGTLEANKAINWVLLCLRMVDAAKAGRAIASVAATSAAPAAPLNSARPGSKVYQIGQMMLRPEGVTGTEAMAATGWAAVAMPRMARRCGLAFTTQRTGNELRYFAQAAAASAAATTTNVSPTLDGLFEFLGCEESERAYFRARAANLGGSVQWQA